MFGLWGLTPELTLSCCPADISARARHSSWLRAAFICSTSSPDNRSVLTCFECATNQWGFKVMHSTPMQISSDCVHCKGQNVDILAKVYLVHLKVEYCQTLPVVSTFTGQNESDRFWLVKALSCIVEGGENYRKNSQNCSTVNSQNSQLTDFDHYRYLPLKFS